MQNDGEALAGEIEAAARVARLRARRRLDQAVGELEAQRTQAAVRLGRRDAVWRRKANLLSGA